ETRRAAAVRAAREAGVYDRIPGARVLVRAGCDGRLVLRDHDGNECVVALNSLAPKARARPPREAPEGRGPAVLWLNEDGTPRAKRGWYRSFDGVNARIARAGLVERPIIAGGTRARRGSTTRLSTSRSPPPSRFGRPPREDRPS